MCDSADVCDSADATRRMFDNADVMGLVLRAWDADEDSLWRLHVVLPRTSRALLRAATCLRGDAEWLRPFRARGAAFGRDALGLDRPKALLDGMCTYRSMPSVCASVAAALERAITGDYRHWWRSVDVICHGGLRRLASQMELYPELQNVCVRIFRRLLDVGCCGHMTEAGQDSMLMMMRGSGVLNALARTTWRGDVNAGELCSLDTQQDACVMLYMGAITKCDATARSAENLLRAVSRWALVPGLRRDIRRVLCNLDEWRCSGDAATMSETLHVAPAVEDAPAPAPAVAPAVYDVPAVCDVPAVEAAPGGWPDWALPDSAGSDGHCTAWATFVGPDSDFYCGPDHSARESPEAFTARIRAGLWDYPFRTHGVCA